MSPSVGSKGTCGLFVLLLVGMPACKCSSRQDITVFAAASLGRALSEIEERFERENPKLNVALEISGSQTACRKISELNRHADVVATADYLVIDGILRPEHADFTIRFATNELVLAHLEHSKHTDEVTADNWPQILLRPGVRLGLVDPDQAPIGYRTQMVWQLAEQTLGLPKGLTAQLRSRCAPEHIMPHESELLRLLQTRTIDYAFVYRSTAEEHRLKTIRLPEAYNLGSMSHRRAYARTRAVVRMSHARKQIVEGAAVVYGLTIPNNAVNRPAAALFVHAMLTGAGLRALRRRGFRPIAPALCIGCTNLPASLVPLVRR